MMYRIVNLLVIVPLPNYIFSLIYSVKLYIVQRSSICNKEKKWRESHIGNALHCGLHKVVVLSHWTQTVITGRGLIKPVVAWTPPLGPNTSHCCLHSRWFWFCLMLRLENHCYNNWRTQERSWPLKQRGTSTSETEAVGWRLYMCEHRQSLRTWTFALLDL